LFVFGADARETSGFSEIVLTIKGILYRTNINFQWDNYTHEYRVILRNDNTFTFFYDGDEIPKENVTKKFQHPHRDDGDFVFYDIGAVGVDVWQAVGGSIFDNIFIGDNLEEAESFSARTFDRRRVGEIISKSIFDEDRVRTIEDFHEDAKIDTDLDFEY
jgi:hypothetical protein